jgi:hypothetical protein
MSSDLVLQRTSVALREILWTEIEPIAAMRDLFQSRQGISFTNPKETHRDNSLKLSLWLYQVTENEFLKNQPPTRPRNGNPLQEAKTPLALNLYYLVTPFMLTAELDLQVLGFVMRVLRYPHHLHQ